MIYTIGKTENYERYFQEQGTPQKLGRQPDYVGGAVWKNREEAENYATQGFSVYGVIADWGKDTEQSKDGDWNNLLVTSDLVKV